MWKRDRNPVASTTASRFQAWSPLASLPAAPYERAPYEPAPYEPAPFTDVATAPIEILSMHVASSLSIPARDAQDLLALACSILHEKPSRVAVLEHGRLTESSARMLAGAAADLEA